MRYCSHRITVGKDLQTVLMKYYSAEEIMIFFQDFLQGVAADRDLALGLSERWGIKIGKRMTKKARVDILVKVFAEERLFAAYYQQQPKFFKDILEKLVWYGIGCVEDLEGRVGKTLAHESGIRAEPFELIDGLELLLLETQGNFSFRVGYTKSHIFAHLPEVMRKTLRTVLPKPWTFYFQPLETKGVTSYTFCAENAIQAGLSSVVEFVRQGCVALKKNGEPSVKGLGDLQKISGSQEFYPSDSNKDLKLLKAKILASFLHSIDLTNIESVIEGHVFLRNALKLWVRNDAYMLVDKLLGHINLKWNHFYSDFDFNVKKSLLKLLKGLPLNSWISMDNIAGYCVVHGINLAEKEIVTLEYKIEQSSDYGSWESWERVNSSTKYQVLYFPLLKGFFFLVAALGLVEIGYELPVNEGLRQPNRDYISVYDGLRYVRLTELGAYATGKTKKYTPANAVQAKKAVFTLDESRLLITMEGEDPVVAITLEQMLEKIGSGRYQMTYRSLLKNCHSKRDVRQKIDLFRRNICKKPPKNWLDFFAKALLRVNPLTLEPDLRVFKIGSDKELIQLIATDPNISQLIHKVEGLRLAITNENLIKFINRMKKHGYVMSAKSLSS